MRVEHIDAQIDVPIQQRYYRVPIPLWATR